MIGIRIIIAGSRDFNNFDYLDKIVLEVITNLKNEGYDTSRENLEIISGTARGADKLGEKFASKYNLKVVRFPADWSIGKAAGYIRNKEMAIYASQDKELGVLIAFWNGSKGTKHMIDLANDKGLRVEIFNFE